MHFCCHAPRLEHVTKAVKTKVKVTATYTRLHAHSKLMARVAQVDLVKGIRTFKKKVSKKALINALEKGASGHVLEVISWHDARFDEFNDTLQKSVNYSTNWTIESLPARINRNLAYSAQNPAIKRFLKERTGARIVGLQEDTQKLVQRVVTRAFTKAYTPKSVADQIHDSIGLDPRRAQALSNYRDQLELDGRHSPDKIDDLVSGYSERLLTDRCMTIGRTETRKASNQGQLSVWKAGADQGFLDRATTTKVWVVDGNPCEICEPMDGVEAPLDGFWTLNTGDVVDDPTDSHPNCYCGMELSFGEDQSEDQDDEAA
jgi:hypothetical protein